MNAFQIKSKLKKLIYSSKCERIQKKSNKNEKNQKVDSPSASFAIPLRNPLFIGLPDLDYRNENLGLILKKSIVDSIFRL